MLKGLFEHGDSSAYFGSTTSLDYYAEKAKEFGWIEQDAEGRWVVTRKGRDHYERSGLREILEL